MTELIVQLVIVFLFVVVAGIIYWDSRSTEKRVARREEACRRREVEIEEREANVQFAVSSRNAAIASQAARIKRLEALVEAKDNDINKLEEANRSLRLRAGRN